MFEFIGKAVVFVVAVAVVVTAIDSIKEDMANDAKLRDATTVTEG